MGAVLLQCLQVLLVVQALAEGIAKGLDWRECLRFPDLLTSMLLLWWTQDSNREVGGEGSHRQDRSVGERYVSGWLY